MSRKFQLLAKADIQERIPLKDEDVTGWIDPVYENGLQFSGEVLVYGEVLSNDIDEEYLVHIVAECHLKNLSKHVRVRKVQWDNPSTNVSPLKKRDIPPPIGKRTG